MNPQDSDICPPGLQDVSSFECGVFASVTGWAPNFIGLVSSFP